jgi:hypothetical protein
MTPKTLLEVAGSLHYFRYSAILKNYEDRALDVLITGTFGSGCNSTVYIFKTFGTSGCAAGHHGND